MKQQLPVLGVRLGKWPAMALCASVISGLFAPALIQSAGLSTDPSIIDNRRPAQFPAWPRSLEDLGAFRDGLIAYADDNFGLRTEMIRLNWRIHAAIGVSSHPGLIVGKHGWVFLDRDNALDQYRGINRFSEKELDAWIDAMENYQRWFAQKGGALVVVIAPNAQTIYSEYLPAWVNIVHPETRLDQIVRRLKERGSNLAFVDLRPALRAAKKNGQLYHKYENHWNALGGFFAYRELMRTIVPLAPSANPLELEDFNVSSRLRNWYIPWETEAVPSLTKKSGSAAGPTLPVADTRHKIYRITSALPGAPSLLFLHDSFGNPGLLDYLKETFSKTTLAYTYEGMEDIGLREHHDVVIIEMVERYLINAVPSPK